MAVIFSPRCLMDVTEIKFFRDLYQSCYAVPQPIADFWSRSESASTFPARGKILNYTLPEGTSFIRAMATDKARLLLHAGGMRELCEHLQIEYPYRENIKHVTEVMEESRATGLIFRKSIRDLYAEKPESDDLWISHLNDEIRTVTMKIQTLNIAISANDKDLGNKSLSDTEVLKLVSLRNMLQLERRACLAHMDGLLE